MNVIGAFFRKKDIQIIATIIHITVSKTTSSAWGWIELVVAKGFIGRIVAHFSTTVAIGAVLATATVTFVTGTSRFVIRRLESLKTTKQKQKRNE